MSTNVKGKNKYYGMLDLPGSMPSNGYIQCHREMAQRMLNRTLKPEECVVRKDRDRNNDKMDNLMVFANRGGARRFYSKHGQEFLFKREDGVYDYDWEAINQQKRVTSENYRIKMQKIKERNEKVNAFIKDNPNCTLNEIAENFFNSKTETARTYLSTHDIKLNTINYNNSNKGIEKLRLMSREDLISYFNIHKISGQQFAKILGASYYSVAQTLSERGVSTVGKHKKFKHLTRQTILDAMKSKPSKQKLARMLGVFEENLEVELWKLGIEHKYKISFVRNNYVMPTEDDYENNNIKHQNEKIDVVKNKKFVENIPETQEKEFNNDNKKDFTLASAYNLGLTFNDIKFITQLSTQDIVNSKNININIDDINQLLEIKKVLTRDNIIALYKAGHSTKDIADIYGYDHSYVYHISETI